MRRDVTKRFPYPGASAVCCDQVHAGASDVEFITSSTVLAASIVYRKSCPRGVLEEMHSLLQGSVARITAVDLPSQRLVAATLFRSRRPGVAVRRQVGRAPSATLQFAPGAVTQTCVAADCASQARTAERERRSLRAGRDCTHSRSGRKGVSQETLLPEPRTGHREWAVPQRRR